MPETAGLFAFGHLNAKQASPLDPKVIVKTNLQYGVHRHHSSHYFGITHDPLVMSACFILPDSEMLAITFQCTETYETQEQDLLHLCEENRKILNACQCLSVTQIVVIYNEGSYEKRKTAEIELRAKLLYKIIGFDYERVSTTF